MEESVDECRESDSQAQESEAHLTAAKRRAGISSWLRVRPLAGFGALKCQIHNLT